MHRPQRRTPLGLRGPEYRTEVWAAPARRRLPGAWAVGSGGVTGAWAVGSGGATGVCSSPQPPQQIESDSGKQSRLSRVIAAIM